MRILTVLSQTYDIGPNIYGTFVNGRIEQFFPSRALEPLEVRDPGISKCIAKRMRELHAVDLGLLGFDSSEPMVWRFIRDWAGLAVSVLERLETVSEKWKEYVEKFALLAVREEMEQYRRYVIAQGKQKVVFARE